VLNRKGPTGRVGRKKRGVLTKNCDGKRNRKNWINQGDSGGSNLVGSKSGRIRGVFKGMGELRRSVRNITGKGSIGPTRRRN